MGNKAKYNRIIIVLAISIISIIILIKTIHFSNLIYVITFIGIFLTSKVVLFKSKSKTTIIIFLLLLLMWPFILKSAIDLKEKIMFSQQTNYLLNKTGIRFSFEDYNKPYKPNSTVMYGGLEQLQIYKINSYGIRDYEYNITKPNGTFRIVALGDSFTFGEKISLNETWPKLLEKKLNSQKNNKFEVINLGVASVNTELEVNFFKNKGLKLSPDMVIIQFLSNDIEDTQIVMKQLDEYYYQLLKNNPDENPKSLMSKVSDYYNNLLREYYNLPNEGFDSVQNAFEELNLITKERNIKIIIFMYENSPQQEEKLKILADNFNWTFFNLREEIGYNLDDLKFRVEKYDSHPSFYANNMTATYLSKVIE